MIWKFFLGNGDILSYEDLERHMQETEVKGCMIARFVYLNINFKSGKKSFQIVCPEFSSQYTIYFHIDMFWMVIKNMLYNCSIFKQRKLFCCKQI